MVSGDLAKAGSFITPWGSGQDHCTHTWTWLGCGEPPSFVGGAKLGQGVCPSGGHTLGDLS